MKILLHNFICKISNRLFPKEIPKHLGRWNIESCDKKLNHKIDLSNEDHCGPCGTYAASASVSNQKQDITPTITHPKNNV